MEHKKCGGELKRREAQTKNPTVRLPRNIAGQNKTGVGKKYK